MARLHVGTATTLAAVPTASCSNADIAYIWLNSYTRKMVYNSTATYATDTSNHPYKQRPSDYGAAGVWVEDIGADQPEVWSMDQIKTGELIIADDGSIHTDSKTSYADTDAGFWFGYDSTAHKINFGNANSYIKWSGTAMAIKMASGETFDLYGSMNLYNGGDITLSPGGDIFLNAEAGATDVNRSMLMWGVDDSDEIILTSDYTSKSLVLYPSADKACSFYIGDDYLLGGGKRFKYVDISTAERFYGEAGLISTGYVAYFSALANAAGDEFTATMRAGPAGFYTSIQCRADDECWIEMYGDIHLISNTPYIGLGAAAGRIEFDNQATDEINFLDCNVGIGTSTPSTYADLTLEGGALCLKERATPTADTNYGKIYTKTDDKLYFQNGAGVEKEIAFVP